MRINLQCWPKRLLAVSALLALCVAVGAARADLVLIQGSVSWDIENDCGSVDDGSSLGAGVDAFDDFGYLVVNGSNACSLSLSLSGSTHTTTTPVVKSGLTVTRTLVASGRFLTYTDVLANPSGAPISAVVRFGGNLGSDSDTTVGGTSSGDLTLTSADTWVVTYQNGIQTAGEVDPVVGFERVSATNATFVGWEERNLGSPGSPPDGYPYARYDVTVPASGSTTLVHRLYLGDYSLSWTAPQPAEIAAAIAAFSATTTPPSPRTGYCSVAGNTTPAGTAIVPGKFLDLAEDQPATDSHYKGALVASFYQGRGITCDVLPGYTKTAELIGSGGPGGGPGPYAYWKKA